MITLDQVLVLQEKVKAAVDKINRLEKENAQLRAQLTASANNNQSLSKKVSDYEAEQNQIEAQILQVLNSLNTVEDTVRGELIEDTVSSELIEGTEHGALIEGTVRSELKIDSEPEEQTVTSSNVPSSDSISDTATPAVTIEPELPFTSDSSDSLSFDEPAFTEASQEEADMFADDTPLQPEFDSINTSTNSAIQLDIY